MPLDPEEHPLHSVVPEPNEAMLRAMRKLVKKLGGKVIPDAHSNRKTIFKKSPNRIETYSYPLACCDREDVLVDLPLGPDEDPLRICLVCDSWSRMVELQT